MTWLARLAFYVVGTSALLLLVSFPALAQGTSIVWPGQSGNPVGYAAVGPLGTSSCPSVTGGTAGNPTFITNCKFTSCPTISASYVVFMSVDWDCGTGGLSVTGSNVTFYGCRIQSNQVGNYNTHPVGSNIYFMYTSFVPRAALYTAPPNAAWPSSGAGKNTTSCSSDAYCINGSDGFETSVQPYNSTSGPVWIDHADTWGFGGGPTYFSTTAQMTLTESWIHDNADPSPQGYHTDGFACYVNGGVGPSNLWGVGNTIASIGNTNGLACQAATGGYSNLQFNENYFSGYGYTIAYCAPSSVLCTNSTFWGNTYGTDVASVWGPIYGSSIPTSTFWGCNKVSVVGGTSWTDGDGWKPSSSDNGKFLLPSNSPFDGTTDYRGNTVCGQTNPAALDFKTQGKNTTSPGQTVVLTNTGTATLNISSIALATGAQFAISSNTCGSSLASNSSCNVTVTFTPTTLGPQTDILNIADNMGSPASPQPVPLIGLGTAGSVSVPPQVQGVGTHVL